MRILVVEDSPRMAQTLKRGLSEECYAVDVEGDGVAGLQMALHAPTAIYQEVVRATLATWYRDIVTDLPVIQEGMAQPTRSPGIGTRLKDSFKQQAGLVVRESR